MLRETTSQKRIIVWNALGSGVYALSSFLLLIIVTRICGSAEAGVFSIGYAIAQLMLTVGVFESTTFFATDAENKFSYEQFLAFKMLTCIAMVIASVVYTSSFSYDDHKAAVAYSLCAFRLLEAFSQFWYSSFQKLERLDIAGFSTVWRSILSIIVFACMLAMTKDIAIGMIVTTFAGIAWEALYDIPRLNRIKRIGKPDFSPKPLVALFVACLPLFISSFLSAYLSNVCKYAIDAVGTDQMQTIFNILFMPSFAINLFMIFFIRPTLTKLALLWLHRDIKPFVAILAKLMLLVAVTTVGVCGICAVIGIPILELFYGVNLDDCLIPLLVIMLGGGLNSAANVFYNGMVVIRAQNGVVIGYLVAIAIATIVAKPLVASQGIMGAAIAYVVASLAVAVSFSLVFSFVFALKLKPANE